MSLHFADVKASLDRYCVAWQSNDGAAVAGFFTDDGSLINLLGQRADGPAAVVLPPAPADS